MLVERTIGGRTIGVIALILAVFLATYTWIDGVHATGFLQAFGMAFATLFAFCLIDLVIIDWGLVCWLRPSWIVVRGTEQAEGWGDYMFHVREQLSPKGLAAMFGIPVVVAAAATALPSISFATIEFSLLTRMALEHSRKVVCNQNPQKHQQKE